MSVSWKCRSLPVPHVLSITEPAAYCTGKLAGGKQARCSSSPACHMGCCPACLQGDRDACQEPLMYSAVQSKLRAAHHHAPCVVVVLHVCRATETLIWSLSCTQQYRASCDQPWRAFSRLPAAPWPQQLQQLVRGLASRPRWRYLGHTWPPAWSSAGCPSCCWSQVGGSQ